MKRPFAWIVLCRSAALLLLAGTVRPVSVTASPAACADRCSA
jgi:hypothetical protein